MWRRHPRFSSQARRTHGTWWTLEAWGTFRSPLPDGPSFPRESLGTSRPLPTPRPLRALRSRESVETSWSFRSLGSVPTVSSWATLLASGTRRSHGSHLARSTLRAGQPVPSWVSLRTPGTFRSRRSRATGRGDGPQGQAQGDSLPRRHSMSPMHIPGK